MVRRGGKFLLFLQGSDLSAVRRGLAKLSYFEAAPVLAKMDEMAKVEVSVPVAVTSAIAASLATERLQRWESAEARGTWQRGA